MLSKLKTFWRTIRELSGDDAYERYLQHFAEFHTDGGEEPLSREVFFKEWQEGKWKGIKRCC